MRITIETDEGKKPRVEQQGEQSGGGGEGGGAAPPPDLAARAAAEGASSAGPAPSDLGAEGSAPFVQVPGTPETAPEGDGPPTTSAGAAPGFAAGDLQVERVEAEDEEGNGSDSDAGGGSGPDERS